MKRVVLLYAALLVVMATAMVWITLRMLDLERSEQLQALSAESERLALWRIESQLLPLVLAESTRDYHALGKKEYERESLDSKARCYFRCDSSGQPEVLWLDLKKPVGEQQTESLPSMTKVISRDVGNPKFFTTLGEAPRKEEILVVRNDADSVSQIDNSPGTSNTLQQAVRSTNEFRNRSFNSVTQNPEILSRMQRWDADIGESNPMTAFWIGDRLYLARSLGGGKVRRAEGCLLDWKALKPSLLESIRDLLPDADLVPLSPDETGDQHTLANLPIRLIPGRPILRNLPVSSALKPTLVVAWSCFLLSAAMLGGLLFGVIRLSERRAAFVSAVTHELRTPLTTFRLYSDLLADRESVSQEKYDRYIETLQNESERLEYLVENVLSWSRLERSAETQLIEDIDGNEFFDRIAPSLRDCAAQAGMTLEFSDPGAAPVRFRGNHTAVERILFNLIDNACKYAKPGDDKRIHVELRQDDRTVRLRVRDHGPGIAPEVRRRLFQPFSKSAEDAARSAPGIGLGLSLSRRLARDMHGDLVLTESQSDGAAFELRLPRSTA